MESPKLDEIAVQVALAVGADETAFVLQRVLDRRGADSVRRGEWASRRRQAVWSEGLVKAHRVIPGGEDLEAPLLAAEPEGWERAVARWGARGICSCRPFCWVGLAGSGWLFAAD